MDKGLRGRCRHARAPHLPGVHRMYVNVKRWDHIVHVIKKHDEYGVYAVCGRRAKISVYGYGQNKLTEEAPTCIVCVAGGFHEPEK